MDNPRSELEAVNSELFEHFSLLAKVREQSELPVFALEHGLDSERFERVKTLLHTHQQSNESNDPYWLVWVVYASEAGYSYDGDEYWPSFESHTPNWQYHDRPKIKSWFTKFQRTFFGVKPSGTWARHFSIIAWPITHSLLPRYLQRQFARLLYDLRFRLTSVHLSAASIGHLLATNANYASTRFRAFLQQETLTGQIAAALLQEETADSIDLIHPYTLHRVVNDLEKARASREWLKETRRITKDRFRGIGQGLYPSGSADDPPNDVLTPASLASLIVRPRLLLRHDGNSSWTVLLQLKSLTRIADMNSALRDFLVNTRCRMNGADDWKPGGWLLSENRKTILRKWPDVSNPLVRFEDSNRMIEHLLESEFRLRDKTLWLFRVGNDGLAHHVDSLTVRPSNDYIFIFTKDCVDSLSNSEPCTIDCIGVRALRFTLPSHVPIELVSQLSQLGVEIARSVHVWPAGLPGREWDGEGNSEWLTNEAPCFGVSSDHPLDAITFKLDDESSETIPIDGEIEPMFVRLSPLRAGNHILSVQAHRWRELDEQVSTKPARGHIRLAVREPEPWISGRTTHAGMIVRSEPYDASLNTLWGNELTLSVNGPESFVVTLRVKLIGIDGEMILSEQVCGSTPLPLTPQKWRSIFADFLENESFAWRYLEAHSCVLEIDGDSLGTCKLRFDHDHSPLRWVLRHDRRQVTLRLVDDTGQHDSEPTVQFFSVDRPLSEIPLSHDSFRSESRIDPPGGLYIAQHGSFSDVAFVSVSPPRAGFADLKVNPIVEIGIDQASLKKSINLLGRWYEARYAGFFALAKRNQVVQSVASELYKAMCGANWATEERSFDEKCSSPIYIDNLTKLVAKRSPFGRRIYEIALRIENDDDLYTHFFGEAKREHIARDPALCRYAIEFADRRFGVLSEPQSETYIGQLANNPSVLRGARLISLVRHSHLYSKTTIDKLEVPE